MRVAPIDRRRIARVSYPLDTLSKLKMRTTRSGWRTAVIAAGGGATLALAVALVDFLGRDLVADAIGPIAVLSEASADDAAGDALAPGENGERFLPVPAPLDDDRVVQALGPLANLACRRDDPVETGRNADAAPAADALNAPLASHASAAQYAQTAPLMAAAVAPLAPVNATEPATRTESAADTDMPADCPALLRHRFNRLQTGESQSLCQFQGKVLLVVNTASYCGYTGQYEGLEALYRRYKGRGLVVVGFPSNDFGGQEPGTNQEIAQFCRLTYGVQFPMFEKSSVTKVGANPLFSSLSASTGVVPQWNFYKYVVDRNGQAVAGFGSRTTPDDRTLVQTIERLLAEKPRG
jgi:glutathione peroxidase